jgi:hypothetical protein
LGNLHGEATAFIGSFLIGGGQVKTVCTVNKAAQVRKAGGIFENIALAGTKVKNTVNTVCEKTGALVPDFTQLQVGYLGVKPVPAGAGVGKGIATITATGIPLKKPVTLSSYADAGKVNNLETAASFRYPIQLEKQESIFKMETVKHRWITQTRTPQIVRESITEWAEASFAKWKEVLLEEEKMAIKQYTMSARSVNAVLRGIDKNFELRIKHQIEWIDSGLKKSVLPEMLLFRGSGHRFLGELAGKNPAELIGKTIQEKGYLSTSLYPQEHFIEGVQTIIKVPEGIHGGYLGELSVFRKEAEVLLERGHKMKILEVERIPEDIWVSGGIHMVVELLPKQKL